MSRATLKAIQAAAGAGAGEAVYVDDVFSTYLYEGNATTRSIVNGLDLDGEGGLVWIKSRTAAYSHVLFDTERGATKRLYTNVINEEDTAATSLTAFNSDGFSLGSLTGVNGSGTDFASWTFRKQPGFFDVVTYTGDGTSTKTVSHNLGSTPGMVVFKRTDSTGNWIVWHRSTPNGSYTQAYLRLNATFITTTLGDYGNSLVPTDSVIKTPVHSNSGNTDDSVNVSGATYVAYIFAHDAQDFGTDSDESIIKCGAFTGNATVDLGFEPQWVMIKRTDNDGNWFIQDSMRGIATGDIDATLFANLSDVDNTNSDRIDLTSTGFIAKYGTGVESWIYVAIRRPQKPAEEFAATDLFAIDTRGSTGDGNAPGFRSGFPVDMAIFDTNITSAGNRRIYSRLTKNFLEPPSTGAEVPANFELDYMNGWLANVNTVSTAYSWMFRRAPGFFDVVAYSGQSTALTVSHNLKVAPELIIIKNRTDSVDWWHVGSTELSNSSGWNKYLRLNTTSAEATIDYWENYTPNSSNFKVRGGTGPVNDTGKTYIAYLFATVPGISKVGSYTGNGTSLDIDCGFTSGARFVLIKASSNEGNWLLFDSARGIVAGNDSWLRLNSTNEQVGGNDLIDPLASGFTVNFDNVNNFDGPNRSGYTYIFLAIA